MTCRSAIISRQSQSNIKANERTNYKCSRLVFHILESMYNSISYSKNINKNIKKYSIIQDYQTHLHSNKIIHRT